MRTTLLAAATLLVLPAAARAAPSVSAQDHLFMQQAAISGRSEVEEGRLAERKARESGVKQFAHRMISAHGADNTRLRRVAARAGIALPPGEDATHAQQYDELQKRNGRDFDRSYIADQVAAHHEMEWRLRKEIRAGHDPAVRRFAERTLPMIGQHLRLAEALDGTLVR